LLGPMPTPAVAYLTRTFRAQAGIVISASHNPYCDNGIKFFGPDGMKLPDDVELQIENEIGQRMTTVDSGRIGKVSRMRDAAGRYIEFCKSTISARIDFSGTKVVVDCAHGSAYHVAPHVFEEMGATVVAMGVQPNGFNINDGVGATSPDRLARAVLDESADFGIALDGDGDRLMMVDHKGKIVDGDEILYIIAASRREKGELSGPVIGTQMSNFGLEHALGKLGIEFRRAAVGDRYVMEMMLDSDSTLGGESSGHIICRDRITTGDGIISALQVMEVMRNTGQSLHELKQGMQKYPQCLINVKIRERVDLEQIEPIQRVKNEIQRELEGCGRVLLRPSGTEPLIRVMVEGIDPHQIRTMADRLASTVSEVLMS
jgi:phosphoglucosamine mutase